MKISSAAGSYANLYKISMGVSFFSLIKKVVAVSSNSTIPIVPNERKDSPIDVQAEIVVFGGIGVAAIVCIALGYLGKYCCEKLEDIKFSRTLREQIAEQQEAIRKRYALRTSNRGQEHEMVFLDKRHKRFTGDKTKVAPVLNPIRSESQLADDPTHADSDTIADAVVNPADKDHA